MRYTLALLLLLSLSAARAQNSGFGAGVMLGEPTGLSGKLWVSPKNAVDMGLAWSFVGDGHLHLHGDYLWHFPNVIHSSSRFVLYAGIGGRLLLADDAQIGVRIPGGIAWWPREAPLDVFLEIAPILDLTPATEFDISGAIGIRYFFD